MYTYTWKKYLPVIRILLKKSATKEQTVNLNRIDFERTTKLRKPVVSFNIDIIRSRIYPISKSVPARDLLTILQEDEKCRELMSENQYNITLGGDFLLTIKNTTPPPDEEPVEKLENNNEENPEA